MNNRAWMPLHIDEYLADTGHLTVAEHGAYLLLIMHYWKRNGLPESEKLIARVAKMDAAQWAESRDVLAMFFDDGWRHKRIDAELAKADEIIEKRRTAANKRHRKSKSSASADAHAEQVDCKSSDTRVPPSTYNQDSSLRSESSAACWTRARLDALTDALIDAGSIGELRPTWIDVSPIVGLIDAGYDIEVDILPKIREGTARLGKPAKSPRYFVEAIRDTGSTRQGLTAAGRQHDPPRQNPLMQAVDKLERELTDERPYDDGPVLDLQVLGN